MTPRAAVAFLVVGTAACGSPRNSASPPPPQIATPTSVDAGLVVVDAPAPPIDAATVGVNDLNALATQVYAELGAARVDAARALVKDRVGACTTHVGASKRSDGGYIVYGARVVLRFDARGTFESYGVERGCVAYADEQVTVIDEPSTGDPAGGRAFRLHGAVAQVESIVGDYIDVQASSAWILLANERGDYLAWPRGATTVLRGTGPEVDEDRVERQVRPPRVVGDYVVTPSRPAKSLYQRDGARAAIKGCAGELLAAAAIPGGAALHVRPASSNATTKLCLVNRQGATRRVISLGRAVCGLAERMDCEWELRATSAQLLVFAGPRGGVVIIDATSGAKLAYRGEPPSQFPATYSSCGDRVCVETATETASASGLLELARGRVQYRARKPSDPVDTVRALADTWCVEGDVLLPCIP